MKSKILFTKMLFLSCLVLALGFTLGGCSDDEDGLQSGYGYAQFKLFKSGAYQGDKMTASRAGTNELDYLREAQKMKIVLMGEDGKEVIQTVGLNAMGSDSELGLRSEKLELMAGNYTIVGFYLYKIQGQELKEILSGEPQENTVIIVVDGGLAVQDIVVKVVERGGVTFSLIKEMVPVSRGVESADKFVFSDVKYALVQVRNEFSKVLTNFRYLPCTYTEKIRTDKSEYAIAVSDSLLKLEAGTYSVTLYSLYDKDKKSLDNDKVTEGITFEVTDNQTIEVEVPVKIHESAEYIQDYFALHEIWIALGGENGGWSNTNSSYPIGVNWNFDKEIDMWGHQPGVGLDDKGRVVNLDLGSFGAKGDIPTALGKLTSLKILSLGTHSDVVGGDFVTQLQKEMTPEQREICRNDYYNKVLKRDLRATFSEPLQMAFKLQGKPIKEQISIGMGGATTRDVSPGNLTNGIRSIPTEIGNLTKLQQLYIANGKFVDFAEGTDLSKLEDLTDMEIYNCPSMKKLPEALFTLPNIALLNLANNPQIASAIFEEGLTKLATGASKEKLQILYLGNNKLTKIPDEFRNFKKLAKLDCVNNQIKTIPAFGRNIGFVQLTMDYNQIEEIPLAADGYFCAFEDIETFSFSHNKIKVFPNTFDAKSVYTMGSIDLSNNEITEFGGGDQFRGMNVATLSLGGNQLKSFPSMLFKNGSRVDALLLSGNGMTEFPDGSLKGPESHYLVTLDLTYNKLTKLPKELQEQAAVTLPYLYGVDLSNNSFSKFPTGLLNVDHLTALVLRNQRDAKGNRTLRDWPKGISMCPSLRILYLAGNDFRKIDDTISPNIFMFEIKDNPNISINVSEVCNSIQYGYYELIYDPTQDIRGCDFLDLEK